MSQDHSPLPPERYHVHEGFASRYLPVARALRVYLPANYRQSRRRYPVFYLQDGQNLFDPATAFLGQCWHLHATLDALVERGRVEPLILVGIDNAREARLEEYTPTRDPALGHGGRAARYGRMLLREIKPFIDGHYRTLPDAHHTGIGGSSLGGLISLYLALRYPRVFDQAAVMSPSVWWNDRAILKFGTRFRAQHRPRIWLDVGDQEGGNPQQVIADTRVLRSVLVRKGWEDGKDLKYVEALHAGHNEHAWAHRAPAMLRYLFPAHRVNDETQIW